MIIKESRAIDKNSLCPTGHYLLGLAKHGWHVKGAISELVDNSFGKQRGDARKVEITYNAARHTLTVFDDGNGMDTIIKAFRLGDTVNILSIDDIGRYGCGGTMAMIWLPTRVRLWTMQGDGIVMRDDISWDEAMKASLLSDIIVGNEGWQKATSKNTPVPLLTAGTGTFIELHLRPEHKFHPDAIQRDLAQTYAPGLRNGRIITWTTISKQGRESAINLASAMPAMPNNKKRRVNIDEVMVYQSKRLPIKSELGLLDDLPYNSSRIAIGFGPRVIMYTRDCFVSQSEGGKSYSGKGIFGWIDLGHGWQEYLTTTKDEINDDRLRAVLMQFIFEKLEHLLKQTEAVRLSIILNNIALDLQRGFDSLLENRTKVTVEPARIIRGNELGGAHEGNGSFPKLSRKKSPWPDDPPGATEIEPPAQTEIRLVEQSDAEMLGALVALNLTGNDLALSVFINIEHAAIIEALKAEPINRLALHAFVTNEIAAELIRHPRLIARIAPQMRETLDKLSDTGRERTRLLNRLLMDCVRNPIAANG